MTGRTFGLVLAGAAVLGALKAMTLLVTFGMVPI